MTKDQVKSILDRVLNWPSERQDDAAHLLASMEDQDESLFRLADDQIDEIQRRRADQTAATLTLDEFNERFGRSKHP